MSSFNWKQYLANYPDLQQAGIIMEKDLISHHSIFGISENRTDCSFDIPITVVTPCSRKENLKKIKESINFDRSEWIIIHDSVFPVTIFPNDLKIREYHHSDTKSIVGNAQRNFALDLLHSFEGYIYYLDDDNLMHPGIFDISLIPNKIYTFNQEDGLFGKHIKIGHIDTAMFMVYYPMVKNIRWNIERYEADGLYIQDCVRYNRNNVIYINKPLCYYNALVEPKVYNYSDLKKMHCSNFEIPKYIFKTSWYSLKCMDPILLKNIHTVAKMNPSYKVFYFDDSDIQTFLEEYSGRCLSAFKKLVAGAYKADLFRYCILEKYGGCYSDIGHVHKTNFDSIIEKCSMVLVKEIKNLGIHNGLLCSKAEHPLLKMAIDQCCNNIEKSLYLDHDVSITGPYMLKEIYESINPPNVKMLMHTITNGQKYITDSGVVIIETKCMNYDKIMYPPGIQHYSTLWKNKMIYC